MRCGGWILWVGVAVGSLVDPVVVQAQTPDSGARAPSASWLQFADLEQSGFSPSALDRVLEFGTRRGVAAGMIVHEGAVVATWGDVARRFPVHSIRKSVLSALYGVYRDRIDLDRTLAELEIDDQPPLTVQEKTARVVDLLSSRSGVYHPAAAEAAEMAEDRPARGSAAPGERWWYNNWDFNVAGTAFARMTGESVLDAAESRLFRPLGMEDYRESHAYESRTEASEHPAFHFRMSTRDLARFGLLFARGGRWGGEQLVPEEWVRESTTRHSETDLGGSQPPGYGYMWWVEADGGFSARGYGGHVVAVYPDLDLVVVLRADTYHERFVSNRGIALLLDRIRDARAGPASAAPELRTLRAEVALESRSAEAEAPDFTRYSGVYGLGKGEVEVRVVGTVDSLVVDYGEGSFRLHPAGEDRFVTEDSGDPVVFETEADGAVARLLSEPVLYRAAASASNRGDTEAAVGWIEEAVRVFSESPRARFNLARAYLATERPDAAAAQLDAALRLDPGFDEAARLRRSLRMRGAWVWGVGALLILTGGWVLRRRLRRGTG